MRNFQSPYELSTIEEKTLATGTLQAKIYGMERYCELVVEKRHNEGK